MATYRCVHCGTTSPFLPLECPRCHLTNTYSQELDLIPDTRPGKKVEPTDPRSIIAVLIGIAVGVMNQDLLAGIIAATITAFVVHTKFGWMLTRVAVFLFLAWLASVLFG